MKFYSIHDTAVNGFNHPFQSQTRATAMRELSHRLKSDELMLDYSKDFKLYECGDFEPTTGVLTGLAEPLFVCDIAELIGTEK